MSRLFFAVLALSLLVGFDYIGAWTAPPALPPNSNVAAPINTSSNNQSKIGTLGVQEIIANSGIFGTDLVIGGDLTAAPGLALDVNGKVGATEYCDASGLNCSAAGPGAGSGLGYNQVWQAVARTQGVWYQNDTPQPIMVFHKNIWNGTHVSVGVSTTNYVDLNFIDYDSDLDNGSTFIIPPGHYYRMNTRTENNSNSQYLYRELR